MSKCMFSGFAAHKYGDMKLRFSSEICLKALSSSKIEIVFFLSKKNLIS